MKKLLISTTVASLLLISACNSDDVKVHETDEIKKKDTSQDDSKLNQNKALTKAITEEEGVIGGQVYEQDGMAIGTLVLEKGVSDEEAKNLADRYAEEIKKEYDDLPVNVQVVRDGKNVANVNLE